MNHCLLMRHGVTDLSGTFCGATDPELNTAGRHQVSVAANALKVSVDVIYSSPLRRALQTAEIFADKWRAKIVVRTELREIHFGVWESLTWKQIEKQYAEVAKEWMAHYPTGKIPGGEDYGDFLKRVKDEAAWLLEKSRTENVFAVTHAGFMRTALQEISGLSSQKAYELTREYGSVIALDPAR